MRCKVVKSRGGVELRYEAGVINDVDNRIVDVFERECPSAFLDMAVLSEGSMIEVVCDARDMTPLSEYLAQPMSAQSMKSLLFQLAEMITLCSALRLPLKNIDYAYGHVFYDKWKQAVRFAYLPLTGIIPDIRKIGLFFEELPIVPDPADELAMSMLVRYRGFFESSRAFNPTQYLSFIKELVELELPSERKASLLRDDFVQYSEENFGSSVEPAQENLAESAYSENAERRGGQIVMGPTGEDRLRSYGGASGDELEVVCPEPLREEPRSLGRSAQKIPGTTVLSELMLEQAGGVLAVTHSIRAEGAAPVKDTISLEGLALPVVASAEEVLLNVEQSPPIEARPLESLGFEEDSELDTSLLGKPQVKRFWLTHQKSGDRFELYGNRFVVGKSKYSTYQVMNTTTVSRSHAIFRCDAEACWITDDSSKNGTYVSGRRVRAGETVRLVQGDVILMSDERFFYEERQS